MPKTWNVMVYQAGNNNLGEEMVYALQEMRTVGTSQEFKRVARVLSLFDPRGLEPRLYDFSRDRPRSGGTDGGLEDFKDPPNFVEGIFRREQRLPQNASLSKNATINKKFEKFKERIFNNLDPDKVIKHFIELPQSSREKDHTLLVLSGHGSGALGDFLTGSEPGGRNIQTSITIPMLGKILREVTGPKTARKIDVLGMDSCLMSNMEVAYELTGCADFLVAAEGFERNIGWPYDRVLGAISQGPDPASLAKMIVNEYTAFYRDYEVVGVSTDHSAIDLQGFRRKVKVVMTPLAEALTNGLTSPEILEAIVLAHWEAQAYKSDDFVDLYDFCDCLIERLVVPGKDKTQSAQIKSRYANVKSPATDIIESCINVKNLIEDGEDPVVLQACFTGAAFQHSHGLSIYFPWFEVPDPLKEDRNDPEKTPDSKVLSEYKNLAFSETKWGEFVETYLDVTRRKRRNEDNKEAKPFARFAPPDESIFLVRPGVQENVRTGVQDHVRGTLTGAGTMKNSPDGFYRSECKDKPVKGKRAPGK
jgi:hypothetical protein